MIETRDLTIVTGWGMAGVVASTLAVILLSPGAASTADTVLMERVSHNLSGDACRRVLEDVIARPADKPVLWLWAEESEPGRTPVASWSRREAPVGPPRPYAFRPGTDSVPQQACSFDSNSVHIVSFEPRKTFSITPGMIDPVD
ncbi:hypothetical protein [Azospirillum agricola]|uniref:hypothetical protein n=1 Tax=Azospirillum agricola TaxID=1720247 RepID=UPI000A0EF5B3|nr:hypothetical protein [Azospirillum agricola]SMH61953.1 hypothetical protein SAMN02982994_6067 [Azospirillum lipoferum]